MPFLPSKKIVCFLLLFSFCLTLNLPLGSIGAIAFVKSNKLDLKNNLINVVGNNYGEQLGTDLVAGDFNHDGFFDLAASAPFYSENDETWKGSVTIYWGPEINSTKKTQIIGENKGDQLGTALESADINADGITDLIISAYQASVFGNYLAGKIYIFFGSKELNQTITIEAKTADLILFGHDKNSRAGLALATGDLNGDKIADLLISAPGGPNIAAKIFAFLGGKDKLVSGIYDLEKFSEISIIGNNKELFGSHLAIGDFDGDKIEDIAIGSYLANDEKKEATGKVYLIQGRTLSPAANNKFEYDLPRFPEIAKSLYGKQTKEWFGFHLAAYNVNHDAYDDLLVGSFMYLYKTKTGKISIFHGQKDFFAPEVSINREIEIIGDNSQNLLGSSIEIGDLDGDKNEELLLGAPGIEDGDNHSAGAVFILPSINEQEGGTFYLPNDLKNFALEGENLDEWFGTSVLVGDFNSDNLADFVIGSPYFEPENGKHGYDFGKIMVIYGKKDLLNTKGDAASGNFIQRGAAIKTIMQNLNLIKKEEIYLKNCREQIEYCLFTFSIKSGFEGIDLGELILYPDVPKENPYYEEITMATMLNLVHGYIDSPQTPFLPEQNLKRAEALKIVLGAINAVSWKYRFELEKEIGDLTKQKSAFIDINSQKNTYWWMFRYLNFATDNGLLDKTENFRPLDDITNEEFLELLKNAQKYLEKK